MKSEETEDWIFKLSNLNFFELKPWRTALVSAITFSLMIRLPIEHSKTLPARVSEHLETFRNCSKFPGTFRSRNLLHAGCLNSSGSSGIRHLSRYRR